MIRDLRPDERAWANACYRALAFAETPPDAVALVAEDHGERIGLGRLVHLAPDVLELGGIWTAEVARGRGIARRMVGALLARAGATPLWCIPFAHLGDFYRSCGFRDATPPYPPAIARKLAAIEAARLPPAIVLAR